MSPDFAKSITWTASHFGNVVPQLSDCCHPCLASRLFPSMGFECRQILQSQPRRSGGVSSLRWVTSSFVAQLDGILSAKLKNCKYLVPNVHSLGRQSFVLDEHKPITAT